MENQKLSTTGQQPILRTYQMYILTLPNLT